MMKPGDMVALDSRISQEIEVIFYDSPGVWSTSHVSDARFVRGHLGLIVEIVHVNKGEVPAFDGAWAKIICPTGVGWLPSSYIKCLS